MLNRKERRKFKEHIEKGRVNAGHLNILSYSDLSTLCQMFGVPVVHDRGTMIAGLVALNGKHVEVKDTPTYNVTKEGLQSLILDCLNDPTNPAVSKMREEISETLVVAMLYVLRKEYGFAEKRIDTFLKSFNDVTDGITSGKLELSDMHREIAKSYKSGKPNLQLRYEDSEIKKQFFDVLSERADKVMVSGCLECPYSNESQLARLLNVQTQKEVTGVIGTYDGSFAYSEKTGVAKL